MWEHSKAPGSWYDYDMEFLIGTYTDDSNSRGVYQIKQDGQGNSLTCQPVSELINPSFLVRHPHHPLAYVVCEIGSDPGSQLVGLMRSPSGIWQRFFERPTRSLDSCHVELSKDARVLVVSHYSSGSFSLLRLDADGRPCSEWYFVDHRTLYHKIRDGVGRHHARQQAAHVHAAHFIDDRRFVVCDLGTDQVVLYALEGAEVLSAERLGIWQLPAETGPRHAVIDFNNAQLFVVAELSNEVFQLDLNRPDPGGVMRIGSCLPPDTEGFSEAAEIYLDSTHSALWVSNRGVDSIVRIGLLGQERGRRQGFRVGPHPRHFWMDEGALMVASRDDNQVVFTTRDSRGMPEWERATSVEIPAPVCVLPID